MPRQYGAPPESQEEQQKNRKYGRDDRRDAQPQDKGSLQEATPTNQQVSLFHRNASVDTRAEDVHHTIGAGPNQAASGSHTHDGGNSALLLTSYVISGSKANPATVLPSIIACLVRLGAKDTTT